MLRAPTIGSRRDCLDDDVHYRDPEAFMQHCSINGTYTSFEKECADRSQSDLLPAAEGRFAAVMTQSQTRYALSFTSGGLLVREGIMVATLYLTTLDWGVTRRSLVEKNLLQARTSSSSVRLTRETIQRISTLDDNELQLFTCLSPTEQRHLMWVATCRRYNFIGEFAEEVLRERFLLMKNYICAGDFDRFLTGKSLWHPELDELKPSTAQKLRQTLFRMLHEAGLRTSEGEIVPAVLSTRVAETLGRRTPSDLRFFPTTQFTTEVQP